MTKKKIQAPNGAATQAEAFFEKYGKHVLVAVVALIVIVAGYLSYKVFVLQPRQEKASTALARGQAYFDQEQFDKALNGDGAGYQGFVRIADDFGSTDAGNLANLYAGLCYANMGKWNDAVKYLEEYAPADDALVSPAAVQALGNAYAHVGQVDKAIDKLKDAASMADSKAKDGVNNTIAPYFLLQAGELLESQNKKDEANELYLNIQKKYVNSPLVQGHEIDKYIERTNK